MSHQPERSEKNCLNCGTIVEGRYCQHCGQENIVTRQGFWSLTLHFLYDVFHFDGKFFDTLRNLLFRPGSLSREYVSGKRQTYLDPIRMYLFTSAIFFLAFFSLKETNTTINTNSSFLRKPARMELTMDVSAQATQRPADTLLKKQLAIITDSTFDVGLDSTFGAAPADSLITFNHKQYKLLVRKADLKPPVEVKKADGWLNRQIALKVKDFNAKYRDNPEEGLSEFLKTLLHKLPYLLFLSLPFFAGLLKLLYIRRKQFYYSDHAVFTLHHYILSFILMLLVLLVNAINSSLNWGILNALVVILTILWPVYLYVGIKRFYQQSRWKTFLKFLLLNLLGFILLVILATVFLILSVFQI